MAYLRVVFCLILAATTCVESNTRLLCYFTNWSQYRSTTAKFVPEDVDPTLCTHIVYAFAGLNGNELKPTDWADDHSRFNVGMYKRLTDLKNRNPALKVMLAVGGWVMGSENFTSMVATNTSRQSFATSAVRYLRSRNFDGLDIDWEYPANRGSPPEDKLNFGMLLEVIRNEFEAEARTSRRPRLLLSAATSASKYTIDLAYDFPSLVQNLDMINLMTYDLHGSWENTTGHNSPLYPHMDESDILNLHWAASYYISNGVPSSLLNIGIGLYGRTFTLVDPNDHGVGSPVVGPGKAGRLTGEDGIFAYYEVCEMLSNGATKYYIDDQVVPYAVKGTQWVGYDDIDSLRPKVKYVKEHNFGGIMTWALDLDDFHGLCGLGKYPLLNAIKTGLNNSTSLKDDPICQGKSDGHYRDPNNCGKFYICSDGLASHHVCADATLFNDKIGECDYAVNVPECHRVVNGIFG